MKQRGACAVGASELEVSVAASSKKIKSWHKATSHERISCQVLTARRKAIKLGQAMYGKAARVLFRACLPTTSYDTPTRLPAALHRPCRLAQTCSNVDGISSPLALKFRPAAEESVASIKHPASEQHRREERTPTSRRHPTSSTRHEQIVVTGCVTGVGRCRVTHCLGPRTKFDGSPLGTAN